ncbi:MAG: transporter substrate-binding domain-containing protein [Sedimenticola sp.]
MRNRTFVGILLSLVISTEASAIDKIVIGTGLKPPLVSSETTPGFLDMLAKEIFQRLGIELEVIILPAERALVNANNGVEDGNLLRIKGLEKRYPNLVRVPEKMMNSEFVGYAVKTIPPKPGWTRLSDMIVTYPKGWKIFDVNVKNTEETVMVGEPLQMFALLQEGRADIALYEKWQGLLQAKNSGLKDYKVLDPPFVSMEMFMYMNKKHKALIPKVAKALQQMKEDGTYQKIFNQTLAPLLR